ncbi:probable aspartic protease At2g35615 [Prunus persica]|uniref:probable aspartic protease At2g35615 n=1 Tax=Prunus persica TaxID=3760 RepID=UPI0009AB81D3|nr:probable aspartic protease At2g35615 [Prunus persica]
MAAQFAKPVRLSLTNFVIFLNLLCLTATASTIERPRSFATKLIHRDSALSPYYNPNATIKDHAMHTLKTSMARLAYLGAKSIVFVTDDTRAGLVGEDNGAQFMASFSIGEPPVPQLLTVDTGSNLLWVQCLPCTKCFEQATPLFDPSKSSTYTTLQCNSPYCTISPSDKCDPSNNCKFSHKYLDGTDVAGLLGTEKFTLDTSDEGISPVANVVFGCADDNDGYNGQPSGNTWSWTFKHIFGNPIGVKILLLHW